MVEDRGAPACSYRIRLVSFYGIYSLVFIGETDMMTQWPATRGGGAAMFGSSMWLNGDLRGTKQLRNVICERERRTPTDPGLDPGVTSEVRKPYQMMDDEGCRRRGLMCYKKTESNLMG